MPRRRRADARAARARSTMPTTSAAVAAERAFTLALGGTCHSPVAALATVDGDMIDFRCEILSEDGAEHRRRRRRGSRSATSTRPAALAAADARPRPAVDPPPVRAAMKPLLVLRPEPGASATRGARARAGPRRRAVARCSTIEPVRWTRARPGRLRRAAADQRQRGAPWRRAAWRACSDLPVSRGRPATAAAARARASASRATGDGGVDDLLARAPRDAAPASPRRRRSPSAPTAPCRRADHRLSHRCRPIAAARPARSVALVAWSTARAPARGWPSSRAESRAPSIAAISAAAAAACGDGWAASQSPTKPSDARAAGPRRAAVPRLRR